MPLRKLATPLQKTFIAMRGELTVILALCEEKGVIEVVGQLNQLISKAEAIAQCPLDDYCPLKKDVKKKAKEHP